MIALIDYGAGNLTSVRKALTALGADFGTPARPDDCARFSAVIVPGVLVYATGLLVLRSAGLEPDYLGTWLPGQVLIGIGIGLAFPTLGAAAAADLPPERFASASAVTSAGRQLGAVLGTAILVAIVGEPQSVAAAAGVADDAYLFGIFAALLSGAAALGLTRSRRVEPVPAPAA